MEPSGYPPEKEQEDLARRVERLEARLEEVERRLGVEDLSSEGAPAAWAAPGAGLEAVELADAGALAGLAGKSLLGLAAAYLLRALTEGGTLAAGAGVGLGLIYALAWLAWAARTPAAEAMTVRLRALTSALILGPLLWEAHLKFKATTSWETAAILVLFSGMALAISWRKNQTAVALIGSLAGLVMSAAFLVTTHDVLPYTTGLLALAVAVEASACLEHYVGERWVVAAFADLAVLLATYVATRPAGSLEGYADVGRGAALAVQTGLMLEYLASTIVRTLGREFRISAFEIAQTSLAMIIAVWGALAVAEGHPRAVLAAGLFCALSGVLCYVVSFAFLERHAGNDRNFYSYAAFGLALALAGSWMLFGGASRVAAWSALAVVFAMAGRETGRMMLKLHAGVYAALGLIVSGLASRTNASYLGTSPHAAGAGEAGWWIAAAGAVAGYGLMLRGGRAAKSVGTYRAASVLLGASAFWALAGAGALAVAPVCRRTAGAEAIHDFCPTVLTLILTGLAAGAAWGFKRWGRPELKWMAWLLTLTATYKLVVQDLQQAQAFGMVLSLLAYGAVLIWLPRLLRGGRTKQPA